MHAISAANDPITTVFAPNHIHITNEEDLTLTSWEDARITGIVGFEHPYSEVYANNRRVVTKGNPTTERDHYTVSSGWFPTTGHNGGSGIIIQGLPTIRINGKEVVYNGCQVKTHAGVLTSVSGGISTITVV